MAVLWLLTALVVGKFGSTLYAPSNRQILGTTVCYHEIGCLAVGDFYDPILRPTIVSPVPLEQINTTLWLYTRDHPKIGKQLPIAVDGLADIDETKPLIFITHGLSSSIFEYWVQSMVAELLSAKDCSIVGVNWADGASLEKIGLTKYPVILENIRVVALQVAYFINLLQEKKGYPLAKIHLIGHSLGAHTFGYVGAKVPGVGRISGLDPPHEYFEGLSNAARLDSTDALFVDIIHTNGKTSTNSGFGYFGELGTIDFYPNGGTLQEGCGLKQTIRDLFNLQPDDILKPLFCSHRFCHYMFIQSIQMCEFVAHPCDTYQNFVQGNCDVCGPDGKSCLLMGFRSSENLSSRRLSKYFLPAGPINDLCRHSYFLVLDLDSNQNSFPIVTGMLDVQLEGTTLKSDTLEIKQRPVVLRQSSEQTLFGTSRLDVGDVRKLTLKWTPLLTNPFIADRLHIRSIIVKKASRIDVNKYERKTYQLRGPGTSGQTTVVQANKEVVFTS